VSCKPYIYVFIYSANIFMVSALYICPSRRLVLCSGGPASSLSIQMVPGSMQMVITYLENETNKISVSIMTTNNMETGV
jgi:hypothetical protein